MHVCAFPGTTRNAARRHWHSSVEKSATATIATVKPLKTVQVLEEVSLLFAACILEEISFHLRFWLLFIFRPFFSIQHLRQRSAAVKSSLLLFRHDLLQHLLYLLFRRTLLHAIALAQHFIFHRFLSVQSRTHNLCAPIVLALLRKDFTTENAAPELALELLQRFIILLLDILTIWLLIFNPVLTYQHTRCIFRRQRLTRRTEINILPRVLMLDAELDCFQFRIAIQVKVSRVDQAVQEIIYATALLRSHTRNCGTQNLSVLPQPHCCHRLVFECLALCLVHRPS